MMGHSFYWNNHSLRFQCTTFNKQNYLCPPPLTLRETALAIKFPLSIIAYFWILIKLKLYQKFILAIFLANIKFASSKYSSY